ncbi:MAG: ketopantoate reductase family protein [Clostridia bacterium]|nr:ketopantoate reductase family protein [Clostridia bacterium]MCR5690184.1 ketopantoate reductase family protein [Clostridiales bacterium]
MKTLLIGAGAIGGTLAVLMTDAGYTVDILEISPQIKEDIEAKGLTLTGAHGDHKVNVKAYGSPDEIEEKYDIVIIAVKYMALIPAAKSALKLLKDDSIVVGMQNGVCTQELASVVGEERTVGAMIGFGATKLSSTEFEMTSLGEMYIGMPGGRTNDKLEKLCEMYCTVVPTKITPDITSRQFSKLIINSCINATAAITGHTLGEMISDKRSVELFLEIAREGMHLADAMKIKVPKYGAVLDYNLLMLSESKAFDKICTLVVKLVAKSKYANVRPSTLQSLERGEKTEIAIFNGYIERMAREYGVKTPVNSKLTEMIHEIEDGKREMSMDNLGEFEYRFL